MRVKEKMLNERALFASPQSPSEDLPFFHNLCDIFVLPFTHSESFGLVVLEAMASGKPAVVSSWQGRPSRLIDNEKDGLIAKVGDIEALVENIKYLAGREDIREAIGLAAREKVIDSYSWEKIGGILEKHLLAILNAKDRLIVLEKFSFSDMKQYLAKSLLWRQSYAGIRLSWTTGEKGFWQPLVILLIFQVNYNFRRTDLIKEGIR